MMPVLVRLPLRRDVRRFEVARHGPAEAKKSTCMNKTDRFKEVS